MRIHFLPWYLCQVGWAPRSCHLWIKIWAVQQELANFLTMYGQGLTSVQPPCLVACKADQCILNGVEASPMSEYNSSSGRIPPIHIKHVDRGIKSIFIQPTGWMKKNWLIYWLPKYPRTVHRACSSSALLWTSTVSKRCDSIALVLLPNWITMERPLHL